MEKYSIIGPIGEGAHGIVFKAKHIQSGEEVALKKIPLKRLDDCIPNSALREIKALQEIGEHQNIVTLREVFPHGTGFVLVFEFMLSDLSEVIRNVDRPITDAQVKSYMRMLLKGVDFCHENNIIHRDLKVSIARFFLFWFCPSTGIVAGMSRSSQRWSKTNCKPCNQLMR